MELLTTKGLMKSKIEDEAAFRNKLPILEILKKFFENEEEKKYEKNIECIIYPIKNVLEIASGSGTHAKYFTENLKSIEIFQPTEFDEERFPIIYEQNKDSKIVKPVIELDVLNKDHWEKISENFYDFCITTNFTHITPWNCSENLFNGISLKLRENALFMLYGPFKLNGEFTTESNKEFDDKLKGKDCTWGLRDIKDIEIIGVNYGFRFLNKIPMPSNNFILIFKKLLKNK